MAKKRARRYDDEFRAGAKAMLEAAGFPDNPSALLTVADKLMVPDRTLRRWFHGESNPPPDKLVNIKKGDMADALEGVAWTLLDSMADANAIQDAPLQQRATAYGIAIDKMRLLRGMPTEIVALIPGVVEAIKAMNQNPSDVFHEIIRLAKQYADSAADRAPGAGTGSTATTP